MFGALNITVLRATNIPNKDIFFTSSDPYVKVTLKEQTFSTYIADLSPKTSTAIWNEKLVFKIESIEQLKGDIIFELWDQDKFSQHDLLLSDKITIELDYNKEFLDVVSLTHEKTKLDLIIHYLPFTIMEKLYQKMDEAKENFKKKLVNQIMDKIADIF